MKKKDLHFITPYSASDGSLEDLLNQFTGSDDAGDDNQDDGGADDSGGVPDDSGDDGDSGADDGDVDDDNDNANDDSDAGEQHKPQKQKQKQLNNDAFAKMRIENRGLMQLLGKLATASGIEFKDSKDLVSKLNDDALDKIAKRSNVPVELLREMEALKNDSMMLKQQQAQVRLENGFRTLISDYNLDEEGLRSFCAELDNAGVDINDSTFDLVNYYKATHMDDIIDMRVQEAVAKALGKREAADNHSTSPIPKRGGGQSGGDKINTQAGLEQFLSKYPAK